MNIWLIKASEPLEIDGDNVRLTRTGILANTLRDQGHKVTYFSSSLKHFEGVQRYNQTTITEKDNIKYILLYGRTYLKRISLNRYLNHLKMAKEFIKVIKKLDTPDLVLTALPTLELAHAAVRFANLAKIPVVVDLRDMWPDIWVDRFPKFSQKIAKKLLLKKFSEMRYICQNATGITGITDGFLKWGLNYAGREKGKFDGVFHLSCPLYDYEEALLKDSYDFWQKNGLSKSEDQIILSYVGSIRPQVEIEKIILICKKLKLKFKLVIAGTGDTIDYLKDKYESENIIFPGWIEKYQIFTLLKMSNIGLAPYKTSQDFEISIPNKPIEYMSFGLPILSSLKGVLESFLKSKNCGYTYDSDEEFITFVEKCSYDKEYYLELSTNSKKAYFDNFEASNVYGSFVQFLEQVQSDFPSNE